MPEIDELRSQALDVVFRALATSEALRNCLIFKGARVLNALIGSSRQSLDLDGNFTAEFVRTHADENDQRQFLETHTRAAVVDFYNRQDPITYSLDQLVVRRQPKRLGRFAWYGFVTELTVRDARAPEIELFVNVEVMSPEALGGNAIADLDLDGHTVVVYSLQRIAGEKLRAFLSSLPSYRRKISYQPMDIRAKDLYDNARILAVHPIAEKRFWSDASTEFVLACRSRYIDCAGVDAFFEEWGQTRERYLNDPRLVAISFEQATESLKIVAEAFVANGVLPFETPLPPSC